MAREAAPLDTDLLEAAPLDTDLLEGGTTAQGRDVNRHVADDAPNVELSLAALGGVEKFNESQLRAVQASVRHVVTLIQGPPGIGKTSMVNALAAVHARLPSGGVQAPMLSTAPSNVGADNALLRHAPTPGLKIGRSGHYDTIQKDAQRYSLAKKAEECEGTAVISMELDQMD